jgi:AraC family transcriptional regulator of adaptative response/methylated-DNA-[protein]-cysteine methyltransferase
VLRFTFGGSSLGLVLVAVSSRGVAAVLFGDDREQLRCELQSRFPAVALAEDHGELDRLAARIVALVEAPSQGWALSDVPLDLQGTGFQREVWQELGQIPAGSTASYAEVARRLGRPEAARAVARACAANPLAVVIPCHRVVGSDGSLAGYRWGRERKRVLLERESAA